MKLNFDRKYKSLGEIIIPQLELPEFLIITGDNGIGKSQFLRAINDGAIKATNSKNNLFYSNFIFKNFIDIQNEIRGTSDINNAQDTIMRSYRNNDYNSYSNQFSLNNRNYIVANVIEELKKDGEIINANRVSSWLFEEASKSKPFAGGILANIFRQYAILEYSNSEKQKRGEVHLNKEEFVEKYGEEPWEKINDMLHNKAGLKFKIIKPSFDDLTCTSYIINCEDDKGNIFLIEDLSSGEKVLLLIATSMYVGGRNGFSGDEILLLDEIDASLHPKMIKNLMNLIKNVFVDQYGIPVIMTTHSPTTVAIAGEENLYIIELNEHNQKELKKIEKNNLLKKLSHGINNLAVTYLNQKNIFVESENDAVNYQRIYNVLLQRDKITNDETLVFIPSGLNKAVQSGDSEIVKSIVSSINHPSIFGIVDWDKKNISTDKIFVLEEGKRYTIENCILDPLLIIIRLILDDTDMLEEFGLPKTFSINADFKDFLCNSQRIVDTFFEKISKSGEINDKDNNDIIDVEYVDDLKLHFPKWYLLCSGHDLELKILECYPKLKKYNRPNELKSKIIDVMITYPSFIPKCFFDLYQKIILA